MGKKRANKETPIPVNAKSMLKLEHVRNLAVWASGEASIPSLGAFFGHRLAALGESLGSLPNPSLFPCQRCESILQPGCNCTVRIENNTTKAKCRRKVPHISTQNNVVYKCNFCSHRNLKRGTPRGHMKEICPPKAKPSLKLKASNSKVLKPVTDSPATPSIAKCTTLLEAKRKKRNRSRSKKAECTSNSAMVDAEKSVSTLSKRKRRSSWTGLKQVAKSSER